MPRPPRQTTAALVTFLLTAVACDGGDSDRLAGSGSNGSSAIDPRAAVLARHSGDLPMDAAIRKAQDDVRRGDQVSSRLERLAVLYVQKARASADPGFYKLAEQCAIWLEQESPDCAEAKLVRGHVLQSLHRFHEAEGVARALVSQRGMFLDHGLLGDVLYDEGRPNEAGVSYQKMLDLKPCLQSYSRGAQLQWLRGDLAGARQLLDMARTAGSAREPESVAWVNTRLAAIELADGELGDANRHCEEALQLVAGYPAALHQRGMIRFTRGDLSGAIADFSAASEKSPLPEHMWAWRDALVAAGQHDDAKRVEADLLRNGASEDPRSFAIYLASRGGPAEQSLALTASELEVRNDVFTLDARAWALHAAGRDAEATSVIEAALAEGTRDARLCLHAGAIALGNQRRATARTHLENARARMNSLLPSERDELRRLESIASDG